MAYFKEELCAVVTIYSVDNCVNVVPRWENQRERHRNFCLRCPQSSCSSSRIKETSASWLLNVLEITMPIDLCPLNWSQGVHIIAPGDLLLFLLDLSFLIFRSLGSDVGSITRKLMDSSDQSHPSKLLEFLTSWPELGVDAQPRVLSRCPTGSPEGSKLRSPVLKKPTS